MRILLVEDDKSMVVILTKFLLRQNYVVDVAQDGEIGWEFVESAQYDLILLDVMLPKLDGISFCRRLREHKNQVLVMLLTARDTTTDKLLGLDSGADDYVVKPFNIQEFGARIRALTRRGNTYFSPILTCGELCLDSNLHQVTYKSKLLQFSRKEYLLLELFLRNQKRVYSCQEIIDHLWAFDTEPPNDSTVRSHIKNIRRELKSAGADDFLATVYGQGYRINPTFIFATTPTTISEQAATSVDLDFAQPDLPDLPDLTKQELLDVSVTEIWQQTKNLNFERLNVLEQFVENLKVGIFEDTLHQKAIQNAHKLSGALGMFGFDYGATLARKIDTLLKSKFPPLSMNSRLADSESLIKKVELLVIRLHRELETADKDNQMPISSPISVTDSAKLVLLNTKILVIGEDIELLTKIKTFFISSGVQCICLDSRANFWASLRSFQPDILIIDISVQSSDWLALCRSIRSDSEWDWLPLIFLTASDDFEVQQQIFVTGADDYVTKPIVFQELYIRISNRLQRIKSLRSRIKKEIASNKSNKLNKLNKLNRGIYDK
jgi:DNA-binding response OmpR family regulator/HPt (histidine-containing phosphotransfer) domain-containing protein